MEWHYKNRIYFFKFEWIVDLLNNIWYHHFFWNKYLDSDFKNWTGFYINTENKEYWKANIYNNVSKEYLINYLWNSSPKKQ